MSKKNKSFYKLIFERRGTVLGAVIILILLTSFIFDFTFEVAPSRGFSNIYALFSGQSLPSGDPVDNKTSTDDSSDVDRYYSMVVPESGYSVKIKWGDIGRRLVAAGGIDPEEFRKNYSDPKYAELLTYLTENKDEGITINRENAYFWVNTLWALGLTQKSDVLEKGVMGTQYKDRVGSFASTGGWTLGAKDSVSLYSSSDIIPLTAEQQDLVYRASENIYRPCCGNPTSFPDCNHGMAILGLLEIMASQGFTEEDMYQAALAFNSYWFTQTYIDLAYFFETKRGISWSDVDPATALSFEYSSAPGYQSIKEQIGNIPGLQPSGASCGA
jgi:hypothetical protein